MRMRTIVGEVGGPLVVERPAFDLNLIWLGMFCFCLWVMAPVDLARAAGDVRTLPSLDGQGRGGYVEFLQAQPHRAFAIAPGGAWSWRAEMPSAELALQGALEDCAAHARRACLAYAVDNELVFDARAWAGAWRPYASNSQAVRAREGLKPGQRFPNLAYRDPFGKPRKLSDDLGRVVVLHFWGSWCPPCQREMPDLQQLHDALRDSRDIRFVFLPVREPVARSRAWVKDKGLALPISDGGVAAEKQGAFLLSNGRTIGDRDVARVFPTTYVLDRHGLVLFAHTGPVGDWRSLGPLLRDAAADSGR